MDWNDDEILRAREFCVAVHHGQFRRDGITPYHTHPFVVADNVSGELKAAAYLHDAIEDTAAANHDELIQMFCERTRAAVLSLTRMANESYERYMARVLENPDAVRIKIADIEHNLSCQPSEHASKKYSAWLPVLKAKAANDEQPR